MQCPNKQESRIVALNTEQLIPTPSRRTTDTSSTVWLKRLIDTGTQYIPQNLNPTQFATLQAITGLLSHAGAKHLARHLDASLTTSAGEAPPCSPPPPIAFDYKLGLDELESISRTRTGYAFTELSPELQDVILNLVATRDLTTRKLDLARWLEDLHTQTNALAAF
jgi:hypothetical protein